jgi:NAD(P)-dependent dehydrogenase (short-subunit alcohol dehydrogenase family)
MEQLEGKVAVITGGASGIGRALADKAAALGMKVVIGDIEQAPLDEAVAALKEQGADVLGVVTDVADLASVEALRDAAVATFGGVHLLCNNAGVGGGGKSWEIPMEHWKWVLDVDLWGVIHGIHAFVPLMLEQGEGHIVNTASVAGLTSTPGLAPYNAAKHGVVTLSETLFHELRNERGDVGVSVLCPAFVNTRIHDSDRNAPQALKDEYAAAAAADGEGNLGAVRDFIKSAVEGGIPPSEVADQVFDAVVARRFYVLTHPYSVPWVKARVDRIVEGGDPASSFG